MSKHDEDIIDERGDSRLGEDPRSTATAGPVQIHPVDLGRIHVPTPVMLSPMAGVTNWPFRVICEEYGPDGLYVAEMITARGSQSQSPALVPFRTERENPFPAIVWGRSVYRRAGGAHRR